MAGNEEISEAVHESSEKSLTLLMIGCGRLGSALLEGLITSSDTKRLLSRILIAVRTVKTCRRVEKILGTHDSISKLGLVVHPSELSKAIRSADIVLLACGHGDYRDVLESPEIQDAFTEKQGNGIIVSLMGGVTISQIFRSLYMTSSPEKTSRAICQIFRALPNVAARVGDSMTTISAENYFPGCEKHIKKHQQVTALFQAVGNVLWLPEDSMNTAGVLCASSLAFHAAIMAAMVDGAVDGALDRKDALAVVAYAARGVSSLIDVGQKPLEIQDSVISPRGSTWIGMETLKGLGVLDGVGRAIKDTMSAAEGMSSSV